VRASSLVTDCITVYGRLFDGSNAQATDGDIAPIVDHTTQTTSKGPRGQARLPAEQISLVLPGSVGDYKRARDLYLEKMEGREIRKITNGTGIISRQYCGWRSNMRYLMKQKLFCWGDDFTIKNEAGEDVFFVDGRAFSIGNKLSFQDMRKNELAFIRQKLLVFKPTYEILREGQVVAEVRKHLFTLFRCRFTVDVPGPNDLEAQGSFLDREYTFNRGGRTVAEVSKRWFTFRDIYGVDVRNEEDDVLILASTVVIDMICHSDKNT
jgi:uncharacterized protein YxjI